MLQPFPASETKGKDNTADGPVSKHSDPYGNWSKAKAPGKDHGKRYAEQPHGKNRNSHTEYAGQHCCSGRACNTPVKHPYKNKLQKRLIKDKAYKRKDG